LIVKSSHSGGFLSAVLERVEGVITKMRDIASRSHYPNYATSFLHAFTTLGVTKGRGTDTFSHRHRGWLRVISTL
jgi:hypothetical protein